VNGSAQQVYLVGDFNGWSKTQTPLVRAVNGSAWTVAVPLQQGRHEYAFIVSDEKGEHWVADPLTRLHEDEFGTESSVVSIEPSSTTATM
jgi:1,4-alpha-glucan branching enzyme